MTTTSDILNDAADLIERVGWVQGAGLVVHPEGRHCALGALFAVSDDSGAAISHLRGVIGSGHPHIPAWNYAPERTEQEVLDALRLAAKQAMA